MTVTLTNDQYEALATLARSGAVDDNSLYQVEKFLKSIEDANSITRYFLHIKWQDGRTAMPPTDHFPREWPPTLTGSITRFDRPVSKVDVQEYVARHCATPVSIYVTKDPAGVYGLTKMEDFFV